MIEIPDYRQGMLYFPAGLHKLVLTAVVCPGEKGLRAFEEWAAKVDYDLIDYATQTMMPALYQKMSALSCDSPLMPRMKSLNSYFFAKNALLVSGVTPVMRALSAEGIDMLFMKGIAALARFNLSLGLRPMSDADILVRNRDAARAMEIAVAGGFRSKRPTEEIRLLESPHSCDFFNERNIGLDLHFCSLFEHTGRGCDEDAWRRAERRVFQGVPVFVMGAEDHVLNLCVNGVRDMLVFHQKNPHNLLWIIDAAREIQSGKIDWQLMAETAEEKMVSYNLLYGLKIIRKIDPGLVPEGVCRTLTDNILFSECHPAHYSGDRGEQKSAGARISDGLTLAGETRALAGETRTLAGETHVLAGETHALVGRLFALADKQALSPRDKKLQRRNAVLEQKIALHRPGLLNLKYKWWVHTYRSPHLCALMRAVGFLRFLRNSWGVVSYAQVPGYVLSRLKEKITKREGR